MQEFGSEVLVGVGAADLDLLFFVFFNVFNAAPPDRVKSHKKVRF